jgi:hypothetical protein
MLTPPALFRPVTESGPSRKLLFAAMLLLGIELTLFAGDVHLLWKPLLLAPSTPAAARVVSISRRAKFRSPFQLDWVSLREGQVLHEGDEVATLDSSTLVLAFEDGRQASVEPNSMLVLGSLGAYALAGHSIQVSLAPGAHGAPKSSAKPAPAAAPASEVAGIRIESNEFTVPEARSPAGGAVLENPRTILLT